MTGRPDHSTRIFGMMFMTVGFLIAATCGLCTAGFALQSLWGLVRYPEQAGFLVIAIPVMLVVGVLPTVIGVLVFRAGRRQVVGDSGRE